jgi:thymidylate synthase (FAD)
MFEQKVLDKGFIKVVDWMGDDSSIVQAARVSVGKGTKTFRDDEKLIRYLMKNQHMSPFEMVQTKWHVKLPIFVARQWIRHRTGSFNEISARYAEFNEEFYVPTVFRKQSTINKQGSSNETVQYEVTSYDVCLAEYKKMLEMGISREMARIVLPVGAYTQWYWSVNLRNLFHFLELRLDSHAQEEIRRYAEAIAEMVKERVPVCYSAFEEFVLHKVE